MRKFISYFDQETELEGYGVTPGEGKYPLVILCHAWEGRDDFICEKADIIASWGYTSFALDMYGKGVVGKSKKENAELKKPFVEDRSFLQRRLLAGYEQACSFVSLDKTKIVGLGFGFGAMCALDLARSGVPLQGAISIFGHFDPPRNVPIVPIKAKILLLHGFNDPVSPMSDLFIFQKQMQENGVDWQSVIYSNTYHAFATPSADNAVSGILYNPVSAQRAWEQVRLFLRDIFL
jgi:dienelactone hydrolase